MKEIDLIKKLSDEGLRVFTMEDLKTLSSKLNINRTYLASLVSKMMKHGLLRKLYRGTYALPNNLLAGSPLHEFEIAEYISQPSAICCWSAISFHGLTDQIIRNIYLMTPYGETIKNTSKYSYKVEEKNYIVIRVQPHQYFGIEKKFINETPFFITDLERTLIDGLVRPQYCGGFFEVMEAFRLAQDRINPNKILKYAELYGILVSKRLGWVFETLEIFSEQVEFLQKIPCKAFYKIDVSKPNKGEIIHRWNLKRNF